MTLIHLRNTDTKQHKKGFFRLKLKFLVNIPLKRGLAFQIARGPSEANCPKDNSKKNSGIPQKASIRI